MAWRRLSSTRGVLTMTNIRHASNGRCGFRVGIQPRVILFQPPRELVYNLIKHAQAHTGARGLATNRPPASNPA